MHEALIRRQWGDQRVGPIACDATAIEAREKPAPQVTRHPRPNHPRPRNVGVRARVRCAPPEPTVIARPVSQSLEQILAELPTTGGVGTKKNS